MNQEAVKPVVTDCNKWNPATWRRVDQLRWLFALACIGFVWFTPLDVLDQHPQLLPFTDFMASWSLQIRRVGEISGPANQANRYCYSVLWCVMPVGFIDDQRKSYSPNWGFRIGSKKDFWLFFLVGIVPFLMMFVLPGGGQAHQSRIGMFMFVNSIGRVIHSPVHVGVTGFFLCAVLYALQAAFRGQLIFLRLQAAQKKL